MKHQKVFRESLFLSICSKFFQFTFGTNYGTTTLASLYTSYSTSSLLQRHRQLFKMSVNRVCLGSLCFWSVNNTGVYFFPHSSAVDQSRRRFRPLVDDFSFGSSTLIGLLVIAVAIATVIVISLVLLRKRQYGTISHGIVEVS